MGGTATRTHAWPCSAARRGTRRVVVNWGPTTLVYQRMQDCTCMPVAPIVSVNFPLTSCPQQHGYLPLRAPPSRRPDRHEENQEFCLTRTLTARACGKCARLGGGARRTGWSARTATGIGSDGAPSAADTKQGAHTLQSYITSY